MKTKEEYREAYLRNYVIKEMLIELGRNHLLQAHKKLDAGEVERRLELKLANVKRKNKFEDVLSEDALESELEKGEAA